MSSASARLDPVRDRVLAAGNLIPSLTLGAQARLDGDHVAVPEGIEGHAAFGPYWPMQSGDYIASFRIKAASRWAHRNRTLFVIEIVEGDIFFAQKGILGREIEREVFDLRFQIEAPPKGRPVEFRIWTWGIVPADIVSLTVRRAA